MQAIHALLGLMIADGASLIFNPFVEKSQCLFIRIQLSHHLFRLTLLSSLLLLCIIISKVTYHWNEELHSTILNILSVKLNLFGVLRRWEGSMTIHCLNCFHLGARMTTSWWTRGKKSAQLLFCYKVNQLFQDKSNCKNINLLKPQYM